MRLGVFLRRNANEVNDALKHLDQPQQDHEHAAPGLSQNPCASGGSGQSKEADEADEKVLFDEKEFEEAIARAKKLPENQIVLDTDDWNIL